MEKKVSKMAEVYEELKPYIKWSTIAKETYNHSFAWFYQKMMTMIIVNSKGHENKTEMKEGEIELLKTALLDMARKLTEVAESL